MPNEFAEQLKARSLRFSIRVMRFCRTFQDIWEGHSDQLFRAASRSAANYRAACRARSHRDFTNKMGTTVEESDESVFWLTLVGGSGLKENGDQQELWRKANSCWRSSPGRQRPPATTTNNPIPQ
jgi:four helix bundle protein